MNSPKISLIAAIAKNRGLGKDNKLLFNIPEDMKHFREKTKGRVVIMGSKTFGSIGKPLPNRTNIVISRQAGFLAPGCVIVHSVDDALAEAKKHTPTLPSPLEGEEKGEGEIFIIGGGIIYKEFLPLADKLYLTVVDAEPKADAFFPDYSEFKKIVSEQQGEYNGLKYKFLELIR